VISADEIMRLTARQMIANRVAELSRCI
jgi:hypothetical protein